jgi:hypothetical protein
LQLIREHSWEIAAAGARSLTRRTQAPAWTQPPPRVSRARWDSRCLDARRNFETDRWLGCPATGEWARAQPAPRSVEATKVPWVSAAVFTTLQRACQCHPLPTMQPAQWHLPLETRGRVGAGVAREAFWRRSSVRGALLSLQAADLREGRRAEEVRKSPGSRQSSEDGRAELLLITKRSKTAAYLHEELTTLG